MIFRPFLLHWRGNYGAVYAKQQAAESVWRAIFQHVFTRDMPTLRHSCALIPERRLLLRRMPLRP